MSRRRHTPDQIITALREAEGVRADEGGPGATIQGAAERERTTEASGGEPDAGQADMVVYGVQVFYGHTRIERSGASQASRGMMSLVPPVQHARSSVAD